MINLSPHAYGGDTVWHNGCEHVIDPDDGRQCGQFEDDPIHEVYRLQRERDDARATVQQLQASLDGALRLNRILSSDHATSPPPVPRET